VSVTRSEFVVCIYESLQLVCISSAVISVEFCAGDGSQEFPIKSKLSVNEHGDPVSAISEEHIGGHLEGLSVEQVRSAADNLLCCGDL
jgi:hypothetical protein